MSRAWVERELVTDDPEEIARTAARLVVEGEARSVEEALRAVSAPGRLRPAVVRHLHAMDLVRLGDAGMTIARREMLESALAVMETIELLEVRLADLGVGYLGVRLAGEAARGRPDLRRPLHLRIHGNRPMASWLEELEVLETRDVRTFTSTTSYGRLSAFEATIDGTVLRGHRCPVDQVPLDGPNLFDGGRVPLADLETVRRLVEVMEPKT